MQVQTWTWSRSYIWRPRCWWWWWRWWWWWWWWWWWLWWWRDDVDQKNYCVDECWWIYIYPTTDVVAWISSSMFTISFFVTVLYYIYTITLYFSFDGIRLFFIIKKPTYTLIHIHYIRLRIYESRNQGSSFTYLDIYCK